MDAQTSNTVIAWATAINAGVAIIYAIFTWGLWRQTKQLAEKTRRLAELTEQQAVQTRDIFEATHRPWVSIEPFRLYAFTDSQVRLEFRLRNHGSSPAFVTRWARRWDWVAANPDLPAEAGDAVTWCVLPGGTTDAVEINFGDPLGVWQRGTRFEVVARYHGADQTQRSTRLLATLRVKGQEQFDVVNVRSEAD